MIKMTRDHTKFARAAIIFVAIGLSGHMALAAMTEPFIRYTVKSKDTLQALTSSLLASPAQWPAVAKLNGMKNPNRIYPGQVIDIPQSLINFKSQTVVASPGKVVSVQGDARLGGNPVVAGAAVPEGAALQTGANSSMLVELGDGSRVQLMPKTLATVITQRSYQLRDPGSSASTTWFSGAIRLVEGVLDTLAEKRALRLTPLEVSTPTSLVGIRGTQFRVAYEDPASGAARTEVLEGKVVTENTQQKVSVNVGGGFGAALKPNERAIKVVALLPPLPEPSLAALVLRERDNTAAGAANWQVGTLPGAQGYRAQLATDEAFEKLLGDVKSSSPSINLASIANGSYYARVRGIDGAGIEGFNAVKRIEIKNAPLALVWPGEVATGAAAQFTPDGLLLKVFNKSVDTPQQWTAQIAQDAALTSQMQTQPVAADGTVLLKGLQPSQRYYVRINGSVQGQAGSSQVYVMDVPANWGNTVLGLAQALQKQR